MDRKKVAGLIGLLIGLTLGVAMIVSVQAHAREVLRCTGRGVAYFQDIGSYPRLSDGRLAEDVARERCGQSINAF